MNVWLLWLATALASYRAWRLVGKDDVTMPIRVRVFYLHRDGQWCDKHSRWRWGLRLIGCPWCLGTWVTIATGAAVHLFVADLLTGRIHNRGALVVLVIGAATALVGFAGERLDQ